MSYDSGIKDEVLVLMLNILKESGAKNQIKTLYDLLLVYESMQLSNENRGLLRSRLEETALLLQRFKDGDRTVLGELRNRKIIK